MFSAGDNQGPFQGLSGAGREPRRNGPECVVRFQTALILIGVSVLALIVAKLFTKLVELMMLGWINRLLGALTSCLVTLVVLGVVIVLFDTVNVKFGLVNSPLLSESVLYEGIKNLANLAFPYMKQLLMLQS